jgi:hypothetical protein
MFLKPFGSISRRSILLALVFLACASSTLAQSGSSRVDDRLFALVQNAKSNTVVSPLAARVALEVAAIGARGPTRDEMLQALSRDPDGNINCQAANRLNLVGFSNSVDVRFGPGTEPDTATKAFVADCSGAIRRGGPPLTADIASKVALVTQFVEPFRRADTRPGLFYGRHGKATSPFLWRTGVLQYARSHGVEVVRLSIRTPVVYRNFSWLGAALYLARSSGKALPRGDLNAAILSLTTIKWPHMTPNYRIRELNSPTGAPKLEGDTRRSGELGLPKLHLVSTNDMMKVFAESGIRHALGRGDFTGFGSAREGEIVKAQQRASLVVNEVGVEASAQTRIVIRYKYKLNVPKATAPIRIVFDHPFWMFVRDDSSGTILFEAYVTDATDH